jgi:hypothetical protein
MTTKLFGLIIIAAWMCPDIAHAQDSLNYSALSLAIGGNQVMNKDLFQSPYTYRGLNFSFGSTYTRVRNENRQALEFMYAGGNIQSIVSPKAKNRLFVFNYDYLFNLRSRMAGKKLSMSAGIGLHTLLSSTTYLPDVALPATYFSGTAWLTLTGSVGYTLKRKSTLTLNTGIPVFGVVHRPDFEINGKTLTRAVFAGKNILLAAGLTYAYRLTPTVGLIATYRYHYFTIDDRGPSLSLLQNGLTIGVNTRF